MNVLLVEDDDHVALALSRVLKHWDIHLVRAATGAAAMAEFDPDQLDAVLLDLGLPDTPGLELCRWIRTRSDLPIIIVTARGELESRIRGLDHGADDYIVKPYDARELVARLRAVARRQSAAKQRPSAATAVDIELGQLTINGARREVAVDGRLLMLTRKEYELLALLAQAPGNVFSRDQILRELWGSGWQTAGRSLEVHVASLRTKLGTRGLVETVRGVGYRLTSRR